MIKNLSDMQMGKMNMKKTFLMLIFLCVANTVFAENDLPFGIRHYDIGQAKSFELEDMDGENFSLDETRGRWVFLHFWASWCGPCREEMPTIQSLIESMSTKKMKFVLVNMAENEDDIFTFMSGIDVEINSLLDTDGLVTEVWKPRGLPTTFLINPQGQVKYQAIGGREWNKPEYVRFLKTLLNSAP